MYDPSIWLATNPSASFSNTQILLYLRANKLGHKPRPMQTATTAKISGACRRIDLVSGKFDDSLMFTLYN